MLASIISALIFKDQSNQKKRKKYYSLNECDQTSSLIAGLEFAEKMGLITELPLRINETSDIT